MNEIRPDGLNGQGEHDHQGLSRRRLLKAAATAAPLVATLPSGAAQAAASAFHCIMQNRQDTQTPTGNPNLTMATTADGYVRVDGLLSTYTKGITNSLQIVQVTGLPSLYFAGEGQIGGVAYTIGGVFDPNTFAGGGWVTSGSPTNVKLMQYYRAVSTTSVTNDPTGVTNCANGSGLTCVFPVSQVGAADTGGTIGNNMGLTVSCLASVAPIPAP